MLTIYDYIYYTVLIAAIITSCKASSSSIPGLFYIRLILYYGLANEVLALLLKYLGKEENTPHYLYIPIEYTLLMFFYGHYTKKPVLKKAMKISIFIYVPVSLLLAFFYDNFEGWPGVIYDISCFMNTVWLILIFYDLDALGTSSITSVPAFWILTGSLIFYSGIFLFNGAYQYFLDHDDHLAQILRETINTGLNCVLYLSFSYAFILSWKKKYL